MSSWLIIPVVMGGELLGQAGPGDPIVRLRPPIRWDETATSPTSTKADVVIRWNEATLSAIRAERTPPPMAARNLAIVHAAIYDAVNAVFQSHHPYLVDIRADAGTSPEAAATSAAYHCLIRLYPRQKVHFDGLYAKCLTEITDVTAKQSGRGLGEFVAGKVLEARARDNADMPGKFVPRKGPGLWQPTLPGYQAALLPMWGHLQPFAIKEGTQPRPPGPPPLNSAVYTAAYRDVKILGAKDSLARTPEQTDIARFWADDAGTSTPPGHWNRIAQDVVLAKGSSLMENARLFALLNFSLADAGLLCWVIKFHHECWRPVTGIRLADEDGNPETDPDPNWEPLLQTPPFPAYTSGHSTFSGAASRLLAKFYGSDEFAFETTSEGLPGVKRSFRRFSQAAEEAGRSRIYGGIHWEFDNSDGLMMGRAIGDYVCRHYLLPLPFRK